MRTICWTSMLLLVANSAVAADRGTLTVRAIGPDGKTLAKSEDFYLCDMNYKPVAKMDTAEGVRTFSNLPEKPLLISVYLEVPGFGQLDFTVDNGGKGYPAEGQTLDVLYEAAQSRYLSAQRVLEDARRDGYVFSKEVLEQMDKAGEFLSQARSNPQDGTAQAALALQSLQCSGPAAETIVVEKGRQKLDRQQGLRPDQMISTFALYEEQEGQKWRDAVSPVFNCGVQFWHWTKVVNGDGSEDLEYLSQRDGTVNRFSEMGKQVRGHAFMWLNGTPKWMKEPTFENVKDTVVAATKILVERYPYVKYWLVSNEPSGSWDNLGFLTPEQIAELIRASSEEAHRLNPAIVRGVNSVMLWGRNAAENLGKNPPVVGEYEFHDLLNKMNVPYEFIGMQIYFHGRDLFEVDRMLERFQKLGKRIYICESDAPSQEIPMPKNPHFPNGHPGQVYYTWYRDWDQTLQADWLEGMFIVCMSKDYVDEWNWWDVAEYEDCYYPWGGLVDNQYRPKESYKKLNQLVERWGKNLNGLGKTYSEVINREK